MFVVVFFFSLYFSVSGYPSSHVSAAMLDVFCTQHVECFCPGGSECTCRLTPHFDSDEEVKIQEKGKAKGEKQA